MYNLIDAKPRAPIRDDIYTPGTFGSGTVNLPDEVACCLSYSADPVSGIPIARRRGRVFIGPLCANVLGGSSLNTESVPDSGFISTVTKAAGDLASIALAAGYVWSVFSPTLNAAAPISSAWVDNAWDTQRRRGNRPTSRTTIAIP
jgi:hypothetical protein